MTEAVGDKDATSKSLEVLRSFFSDCDLLTSLDFNLDKLFFGLMIVTAAASWLVLATLSDSGEAMGAASFCGLPVTEGSEPESVSSI